MGNSRAFHYASAFAAYALLTGCDYPRAWSKSDIQGMIVDAEQPVMRRNIEQDAKIADLERKVNMLETKLDIVDGERESLRKTVNNNADIANDNAIRAMTSRGACGTERVDYPDGSWSFRNRQCTKADLR